MNYNKKTHLILPVGGLRERFLTGRTSYDLIIMLTLYKIRITFSYFFFIFYFFYKKIAETELHIATRVIRLNGIEVLKNLIRIILLLLKHLIARYLSIFIDSTLFNYISLIHHLIIMNSKNMIFSFRELELAKVLREEE